MTKNKYRNTLSSKQRAANLKLKIDPSFVHHRKIETIMGAQGTNYINEQILLIPESTPEWRKKVHIDHIYSDMFLFLCENWRVPSLFEILSKQQGELFNSTHITKEFKDLFDVKRAKIEIETNGTIDKKVFIELSTERIAGDTLKSRLQHGGEQISIVAQFYKMTDDEIIFDPIILGFPWLTDEKQEASFDTMWFHYNFYEHFVEDIDEFKKVKDISIPEDFSIMKKIPENTVKKALAKIIKENTIKDWGGETSDLFTSHLHLNGKRLNAAFLLKGPAKFHPMGLNHLGKNNDQIVRLSKEPPDLLIVQHSHDITQPVRETLRAFAVQPGNPRRYCLIDGRDTLRILKAYNLLDWATDKE